MRLALKTTTYAITHFVVAIAVAYALTRDWRIAIAIGLIEPAAQTVGLGALLACNRPGEAPPPLGLERRPPPPVRLRPERRIEWRLQ